MTAGLKRDDHTTQHKRMHFRKRMQRPVEFTLGKDARRFGVCRNVSLGGMLMETAEPAAFGARVTIFMELEGLDGETSLPGVVRWTKEGLMGVQFDLCGARITYALLGMLTSAHAFR